MYFSIDFRAKTVKIGDVSVKLQIWDTAGQERFKTITTAYYRRAKGVILVYSVCDRDSFTSLTTWLEMVDSHATDRIATMLVGNKCDMAGERLVETAEGRELAEKRGLLFYETSAKTGECVEEAFMELVNIIYKKMKQLEEEAAVRPKSAANRNISLEAPKRGEPTTQGGCCR
jgi:small GTP-binding protein